MYLKLLFISFYFIGFISCQSDNVNVSTITNHNILTKTSAIDSTASKKNEIEESKINPQKNDSITTFTVDDYPISNKMFKNNYGSLKSGEIISHDKAWFSNDSLQQTLVFELYTDYHRILIYHFYNNDIPSDLLNRMEFHTEGGKLASEKQKTNDFKGFLPKANKINSSNFVTLKNFKLGDSKQKAIECYGIPFKKSTNNNLDKFEWTFEGENTYENTVELQGKRIAKDSFGHQVIMYFRNEKLIGLILHNEIP